LRTRESGLRKGEREEEDERADDAQYLHVPGRLHPQRIVMGVPTGMSLESRRMSLSRPDAAM
jgi:hypothetical protein